MDFRTACQETPLLPLLQPFRPSLILLSKEVKYPGFLLPSIFVTLNGQINIISLFGFAAIWSSSCGLSCLLL